MLLSCKRGIFEDVGAGNLRVVTLFINKAFALQGRSHAFLRASGQNASEILYPLKATLVALFDLQFLGYCIVLRLVYYFADTLEYSMYNLSRSHG